VLCISETLECCFNAHACSGQASRPTTTTQKQVVAACNPGDPRIGRCLLHLWCTGGRLTNTLRLDAAAAGQGNCDCVQ
jgi:hypothetical protein